MTQFRTLDDLEVKGRRVILRADLNVPVSDGRVTDDSRLVRLAPTIAELASKGARVAVISHFGRPKSRGAENSLKQVVPALARALGCKIVFVEDCVGAAAEAAIRDLPEGGVAVLENLRFHAGEEKNDPEFAAALARLGEIYVNDAFSAAHRAHASTDTLARLLPNAAGRLMQEELDHLGRALARPVRPLAAIVGGAKISTKLDLLANLAAKVDRLIIGGGMANTFLHARGVEVGKSLCERDLAETARQIEDAAKRAGCALLLPEDAVVAPALAAGVATRTVPIGAVPPNQLILDIGPASIAALGKELENCRTLVWNGPVGAFETPPFDAGTNALARRAAELTDRGGLLTVAGGGDTVAALGHAGVVKRFSYVSTAGGAFLEWLEGKTLPGVAALAPR